MLIAHRNMHNPLFFLSRMILTVVGGLVFGLNGYYITLAWASCSLMYFMVSPAVFRAVAMTW